MAGKDEEDRGVHAVRAVQEKMPLRIGHAESFEKELRRLSEDIGGGNHSLI